MSYHIVKIDGIDKWTVRSNDDAAWPPCPIDFDSPQEASAWLQGWAFRDKEDNPYYRLEPYDHLAKTRAIIDRRHGQPVAWVDYDDINVHEADELAETMLDALNGRGY